jgi:hypothetical protein
MVISDLQHIESATKTEVQGGCRRWWCPSGNMIFRPSSIDPLSYNVAGAEAGAQAFGTNTITSTTTDTLAIQEQFSGSDSGSFAEAS